MLDPSGVYVLKNGYTPSTQAVLTINVAKSKPTHDPDPRPHGSDGQLVNSTLDQVVINGVFNDTTGKIDFTYAVSALPVLTKHYRGFAMWDDQNQVRMMAGTFTQYEIIESNDTLHLQFAEHGWSATKQ